MQFDANSVAFMPESIVLDIHQYAKITFDPNQIRKSIVIRKQIINIS